MNNTQGCLMNTNAFDEAAKNIRQAARICGGTQDNEHGLVVNGTGGYKWGVWERARQCSWNAIRGAVCNGKNDEYRLPCVRSSRSHAALARFFASPSDGKLHVLDDFALRVLPKHRLGRPREPVLLADALDRRAKGMLRQTRVGAQVVQRLDLLHEEVARLPRPPLAQLNLGVVQLPRLLVLAVYLLLPHLAVVLRLLLQPLHRDALVLELQLALLVPEPRLVLLLAVDVLGALQLPRRALLTNMTN